MCITPDSLATERHARTVPFHEFLVEYKQNSKIIYYFVEGKDDPHFYNRAIDNEIPTGWDKRFFIANGRDNVLFLFAALQSRINVHQVLFFVDRDLSDPLSEELPQADNLYITDGYSIENSICNVKTLKNVLSEVFEFHNATPDNWDIICSTYEKLFDDFIKIITPVMAYILFLRSEEKQLCLNLNNFSAKVLFSIDNNFKLIDKSCSNTDKYKLLEEKCGFKNCRNNYIETVWINKISMSNRNNNCIRGKFLSCFFAVFCLKLYDNYKTLINNPNLKPSCSQTFSDSNPLCVISPRCPIPETLRDFLQKNIAEFKTKLSH